MKINKYIKWIFLVLCVAINIFIIVNACLNGETSAAESARFSNWLANVLNTFFIGLINYQNSDAFAGLVRKLVGHFGLFAVSGLLTLPTLFLFLRETKFTRFYWFLSASLVLGLLLACLTEFIQIFTPGRSENFVDITIDFGGYLFGTGICFAIMYFEHFVDFKK